MENKLKSNRIPYIDIAKGITIFLVIIGHAANNLDQPFYRLVLYYFHMPLFFMLSGMLMKPKETYDKDTWKKMLKKNAIVLIVPYFIWGIMYAKFSFYNIGRIGYGSWKSLTNAETLTSLWYIPCLYLVRIEVHLLFQLFKKLKTNILVSAVISSVIAFAIGFLLPYNDVRGYFWCFDISFVALGFVLLGFASKGLFDKLCSAQTLWHILGVIISTIGFAAGCLIPKEKLSLVLMCDNVYGNIPLFFWNAFWGSMIVMFLSMVISKYVDRFKLSKQIIYIGQNTFAIYLLHKPILQKLAMNFFGLFGFDAYDFWIVVLASFLTLFVCVWAMRIIETYIPQFLGKFPEPHVKVVENAEEA